MEAKTIVNMIQDVITVEGGFVRGIILEKRAKLKLYLEELNKHVLTCGDWVSVIKRAIHEKKHSPRYFGECNMAGLTTLCSLTVPNLTEIGKTLISECPDNKVDKYFNDLLSETYVDMFGGFTYSDVQNFKIFENSVVKLRGSDVIANENASHLQSCETNYDIALLAVKILMSLFGAHLTIKFWKDFPNTTILVSEIRVRGNTCVVDFNLDIFPNEYVPFDWTQSPGYCIGCGHATQYKFTGTFGQPGSPIYPQYGMSSQHFNHPQDQINKQFADMNGYAGTIKGRFPKQNENLEDYLARIKREDEESSDAAKQENPNETPNPFQQNYCQVIPLHDQWGSPTPMCGPFAGGTHKDVKFRFFMDQTMYLKFQQFILTEPVLKD